MAQNDVSIRVGVHDTTKPSLDDLRARLDEIARKNVEAVVGVKDKAALLASDRIKVELDKLDRKVASPRISLDGIAAAELKLASLDVQLDKLNKKDVSVTVKVKQAVTGALSGIGAQLGRAGLGAGIFAGGSTALAAAAPLGAAALAMGTFGAVAIPVLSKVTTAQSALNAAQAQYAASPAYGPAATSAQIASAKAAVVSAEASLQAAKGHQAQAAAQLRLTAAQANLNKLMGQGNQMSSQRKAALAAEQKATDGLTGSQKAMMGPLQQIQGLWDKLENAMSPLITSVLKLGAGMLSTLMPALSELAQAGGQALIGLLGPLETMFKSNLFDQFIGEMSYFAKAVSPLIGGILAQLLNLLMKLFITLMPSGVQILQTLVPAIIDFAVSLIPVINWAAKVVAAVVNWLDKTHLLIPVLYALGLAMTAGFGPLGLIITTVILVIRYHTQLEATLKRVWTNIKNWVLDAVRWITDSWGKYLFPGLYLIIKVTEYVRDHWKQIWAEVQRIAQDLVNWVWHDFIQKLVTFFTQTIPQAFDTARHDIANVFDGIRRDIASAWNTIWANTVTRTVNGIRDVVGWVQGLPGKILGVLGKAGNLLLNWGKGIISGLIAGARAAWNSVVSFFKGIPHDILHALGIASPPKWAIDAGTHIMNGLGIGMSKAKGVVSNIAGSVSGTVIGALGGSGVNRWRGVVDQALKMEGLSQGLDSRVLYQMQTESGGNPNAINNWDINAKNGDPSRGLMQVIGSTFAAYHWPGTSMNIYDPLANIAAAINYARHVYGPGLQANGMGIGSGHGYAAGGATSAGWAMLGERGRELVKLPGGATVYPHSGSIGGLPGDLHITLELGDSFRRAGLSEQQLEDIRYTVRTKGGGDVQRALGRN